MGQLLAWLLDGYVVGLVRACFYVTESVGQKNALRFYRQEVWAKLLDLAFRYTHAQWLIFIQLWDKSSQNENHFCDLEVTSLRARWRS